MGRVDCKVKAPAPELELLGQGQSTSAKSALARINYQQCASIASPEFDAVDIMPASSVSCQSRSWTRLIYGTAH
eukprot:6189344-Pleurochrysis_carterae.AAC.2